jgi:hypothetical protein
MLPAKFLIDYVRVYQDKSDSNQTIGCDPVNYPTKEFIEGHTYRFERRRDTHALLCYLTV